jgi:hypothetical protein
MSQTVTVSYFFSFNFIIITVHQKNTEEKTALYKED